MESSITEVADNFELGDAFGMTLEFFARRIVCVGLIDWKPAAQIAYITAHA
jgi:hypothetical protein